MEIVLDKDFDELCQSLLAYGITKIISYDDEWKDIDKETNVIIKDDWLDKEVYDFTEAFFAEQELECEEYIKIKDYIDFNFQSSKVKDILNSNIEDILPLKQKLEDKFKKSDETLNMLKQLRVLLNDIRNRTGIAWEYRASSFEKTDVSEISNRVLFLIDKDMRNGGGMDDSIKQVIPDINSSRPHFMDLMLVYTNDNISNIEKHEDKVKYFISEKDNIDPHITEEDAYLLAYQLWPFKKTHDKDILTKNFNNILKEAALGHSLYEHLSLEIDYRKKTSNEILKLSADIFKYLYKDSFIEGTLFTNALEELSNCVYNRVKYNSVKDERNKLAFKTMNSYISQINQQIVCEINEIENKDNNVTEYRQTLCTEKLTEKLYKDLSEFGIVDYSVNSRFLDVSTGDIFLLNLKETNEVKFGILLTQECDLVVRFKGNGSKKIGRVAQKADLLLCDFLKISNSTSYDNLKNKLWPIKVNEIEYAFDITNKNKMLSLDINLIDLCSLDSNGQAVLDIKEECLQYKTYHYVKYYNNDIKPWIEKIQGIEHYGNRYNNLINYLKKHFNNENDNIKKEFLKFTKEIEYKVEYNKELNHFNIQRIGRLEKNHVLSIIQSMYNHKGRIGINPTPMIS